jgi:hypothetical protein
MSDIPFETMMTLRGSVGDALVAWFMDQEEAGVSAEDAWFVAVRVLLGTAATIGGEGMDLDEFVDLSSIAFAMFNERETVQ